MNSAEMIERAEIGIRHLAPELADEERRIRRAMRLKPNLLAQKTPRTLAPTMVSGAALLAGGFCLGWKAFRVWHE